MNFHHTIAVVKGSTYITSNSVIFKSFSFDLEILTSGKPTDPFFGYLNAKIKGFY